jgi:predicted GNAT family N-acyltransferase
MIVECRKVNVREVQLTATKTAKNFYEEMGFSQVGDTVQIKMGDQTLECFKMATSLE